MVKGLTHFQNFFKDFTENYILIGGAACDEFMTEAGLNFRATKDLDIILIVEALSSDFVEQFWEYIKEGGYGDKQKSESERKYYRFLKPRNEEFPTQIELFARNPDLLDLDEDTELTPIPADEDLSSLSAILMNEEYYGFTLDNSEIKEGLHLASIETLICLKAKAFLDLKQRKESGEEVDERNIKKHKNDVIRLAVLLSEDKSIELPVTIRDDMKQFMKSTEEETIDFKSIGKNIGIPNLNGQSVLHQIKKTFSL